jgi:hypothetical protein
MALLLLLLTLAAPPVWPPRLPEPPRRGCNCAACWCAAGGGCQCNVPITDIDYDGAISR